MERYTLLPPPNSHTSTYIMVKPDGVERGLVGEIIKRFESKGFKLCGLRQLVAPRSLLEQHYADLAGKPFFPKLMKYMGSGPVVGMVWQGKGAVKTGRKMLGETNPGSDSPENAEKEIALWFPEGACSWERSFDTYLYE